MYTLNGPAVIMRKPIFTALIFLFLCQISCHPLYRAVAVQYNNYRIESSGVAAASLTTLLKPYQDSVQRRMSDVLGESAQLLEKKIRDNSLGYFMADAYLFMATKRFNQPVDAAFMNFGGIRLNELPAGKITRGKIFELMPFDNLLLLQKLSGRILRQYLDTLAREEAIVVSGITLTVTNKSVKNVRIGGMPLDENREYLVAHSDYTISTSDLLKSLPVQNIGYLQRDALIGYISWHSQQGKKVGVDNLNRVMYAE